MNQKDYKQLYDIFYILFNDECFICNKKECYARYYCNNELNYFVNGFSLTLHNKHDNHKCCIRKDGIVLVDQTKPPYNIKFVCKNLDYNLNISCSYRWSLYDVLLMKKDKEIMRATKSEVSCSGNKIFQPNSLNESLVFLRDKTSKVLENIIFI